MSGRKKVGQPYKSDRLDEMARKRDERHVRAAYRKEKKMAQHMSDDENYGSFANQLAKMGCQLREIPGDGNCLFRALGDQFEGHGRYHFKHRLEVCQYMQDHREDFEPFVEDDVPFDRHLVNLKQMGTYAGNDAIVAFARLHGVNVVIHQLNSPSLSITGSNDPTSRELHISYHNGDHYSSIRKIGDNTEAPAYIKMTHPMEAPKPPSHVTHHVTPACNGFQRYSPEPDYPSAYDASISYTSNGYDSDYDNVPSHRHRNGAYVARAIRDKGDVEDHVMQVTNCRDQQLVIQVLEEQFYDVDAAIAYILSVTSTGNSFNHDDNSQLSSQSDSGIWSENGTATRLFGSHETEPVYSTVDKTKGAKPKERPLSAKEVKKLKKLEKKNRASERHRQRLLGLPADSYEGHMPAEDDSLTVIADSMGMVKI